MKLPQVVMFFSRILLLVTLYSIGLAHFSWANPPTFEKQRDDLWGRFKKKQFSSKQIPSNRPPRLLKDSAKSDYRPLESGIHTLHTEHFRIIWGNIINSESKFLFWQDENFNQIPDYIDQVKTIAEESWQKLIDEEGFRPPHNTEQFYLDIYLANTGVLDPDHAGFLNIRSFSAFADTYADQTPYLAIREDLDPKDLQVTLAHELFHAIQFAYKPLSPQVNELSEVWWYEASAMWAEDIVYDNVNDYVRLVNSWMATADLSFLFRNGSHEYGGAIWAKYLTEHFNEANDTHGSKVMKNIWEKFETDSLKNAFEHTLTVQTTNPSIKSLSHAFSDFAGKILFSKKFFKDGNLFSSLPAEKSFDSVPQKLTPKRSDSSQIWGIKHYQLDRPSNLPHDVIIHFDGEDKSSSQSIRWKLMLVTESSQGAIVQQGPFNPDPYGYQKLMLTTADNWTTAHIVITPTTDDFPKNNQSLPYVPFEVTLNFDHTFLEEVTLQEYQDGVLTKHSVAANGGVQLNLDQGWNLIGWPFPRDTYMVSTHLSSLLPFTDSIWTWQNSQWYVFFSETSSIASSNRHLFPALTELPSYAGFWIRLNHPISFHIPPSENEPFSLQFKPGWHLYTSHQTPWSDFGLSKYSKATIWRWQGTGWDTQQIDFAANRIADFPAGEGFWILVSSQ